MSETPYNQGFTGLLLNGQIDEIVVSFFGHKKAQAKVCLLYTS